jgi:aldehyde dehydrogenase (NAD+)
VSAVVGAAERKELALGAADSVKRVKTRKAEEDIDWYSDGSQGVYEIRDFIEFKTTWHPIGV